MIQKHFLIEQKKTCVLFCVDLKEKNKRKSFSFSFSPTKTQRREKTRPNSSDNQLGTETLCDELFNAFRRVEKPWKPLFFFQLHSTS